MNSKQSKKRNPLSYSIWLIPEGEIYSKLNKIIIDLAKNYTKIEFTPHFTLLGGFIGELDQMNIKSKNLSKNISPFDLVFDELSFLNEFFRFLFIKIRADNQLKNARLLATKEFGFSDSDYLPHLSLAYGNFSRAIIEEMNLYAFEKLKGIDGFCVESIYLAHNDEINYKWNIVECYRLS